MPKPGYYYYENLRALKGFLFLGIFVLFVMLSRYEVPTTDPIELFREYRVFIFAGLATFALILWLVRLYQMRFHEPKPKHYRTRPEFIAALTRYQEHMGYLHGWVYHRSNELWPYEDFIHRD